MSAAAGPTQAEPQPDHLGSTCIPTDVQHMRMDSLELRVGVLESQHVWLRVEQLEAQVRSMAKIVAFLVDGDDAHDNSSSIDSGADARRRVQL